MQRTPDARLAWIALVVGVIAVSVMIVPTISGGTETARSASIDDCERDRIGQSTLMILDRFGWETDQECNTVMTTEMGDDEIRVTGNVSPGETITIILPDGLADANVTVNGEPVAPADAGGKIGVVVPDDGELRIVIEVEHAKHEIHLSGSETGTEVRSSSVSSSNSSSSMSVSTSTSTTTSVSTSTNTSTSTSVSMSSDSTERTG